jgi:hypothetical protein
MGGQIAMLERWLANVRQLAIDVGLEPEAAMRMEVREFMREVADRKQARGERSEWLSKVLSHCDQATRTSLATMSALGKSSSKVRKAVGS